MYDGLCQREMIGETMFLVVPTVQLSPLPRPQPPCRCQAGTGLKDGLGKNSRNIPISIILKCLFSDRKPRELP